MNDEIVRMTIEQCHAIMDEVNNLSKKWVSCRDITLAKNFQAKDINDVENMGNTVEDLHNEELHGEMSYIFEDGVEGYVGKSRFNSMNEKEVKKILQKAIKRLVVRKILNKIKRTITKGMHVGMMM
jgi:hypothetical protein